MFAKSSLYLLQTWANYVTEPSLPGSWENICKEELSCGWGWVQRGGAGTIAKTQSSPVRDCQTLIVSLRQTGNTQRAAENKVPSAVVALSQYREWYPITATSSHCYIRAQCYTRIITLIIIQDHTRIPSKLHQRENLPVNIGRDEDIASGHDNICLSDPCSSNRLRTDWCLLGQYLHYFCIY